MKLPRWLLIAMLATSTLGVLVAAAFWWVTWPERTAGSFTALLKDAEVDKINAMIRKHDENMKDYVSEDDIWLYFENDWQSGDGGGGGHRIGMPRHLWVARFENRVAERRCMADLLLARTTFDIDRTLKLKVERNVVSFWIP